MAKSFCENHKKRNNMDKQVKITLDEQQIEVVDSLIIALYKATNIRTSRTSFVKGCYERIGLENDTLVEHTAQ